MARQDRQRVFLVDGYGLAYRAYYALLGRPLRTSYGENTSVPWGVTRFLRKLVADHHPEYIAFVFDAGSSFRREIYPAYKDTRDKLGEVEADEFTVSTRRLRQILAALRIPAIAVRGYEADDVIGTLAARANESGLDAVIVSGDTDFYQLVGAHTAVIEPGRQGRAFIEPQWVDERAATARIGVAPDRAVDYFALVGDRSDNVPGVRGIGPKTARSLLREHGSLGQVLARAGDIRAKRAREALERHADDARMSAQLVAIHTDVPVDLDLSALAAREPDRERLRDVFVELEFHTLLHEFAPPGTEVAEYDATGDPGRLRRVAAAARDRGRVAIAVASDPGTPRSSPAVGLALAAEPGDAVYVPLRGGEPPAEARDLLASPSIQKLGHDLKPALLSLRAAGIEPAGPLADAMLASYCIDPARRQYDLEALVVEHLGHRLRADPQGRAQPSTLPEDRLGAITAERADAALRLADRVLPELERRGVRRLYHDLEMPLLPVLADMEWTGIGVDRPLLDRIGRELETAIAAAKRRALSAAGREVNLDSPLQLRGVLFDDLGLRVIKRTRTGPSTDADVLEELAAEHPFPARVLAYRELAKLKSTYVDALRARIDPGTGRLHTSFHQATTITGRLSSSEPNLQNVPVRTELGANLRKAFVAEPGRALLAADYSQIELRVFAHLAGDPVFVGALTTGRDVHVETASRVFRVDHADVTARMRETAKTVNYATLYGQGARALARRLDIPEDSAEAFIADYYARFPKVRAYLDHQIRLARERGYVETVAGRRRYVPELRSGVPRIRNFGERVVRNTPIQGSAADLIKLAMIRIHDRVADERLPCRMLLQVHDELLFEVDERAVDAAAAVIRREMEHVATLRVPITVDLGVGHSWYDTKVGSREQAA